MICAMAPLRSLRETQKTGLTFVSFCKLVSCTLITIILVFLRTYRIFTLAGSTYTSGFIVCIQQTMEKENKKENW
jgi:hypothetical protein